MDSSSPTSRCQSCGLIHYGGLWYRERRRRDVRYRPLICPACRLAHRQPRARGKVDWEKGSAYPSGRAPGWGWAGRALGRLASTLLELPVIGWFRRRERPARKLKATPPADPPAPGSGRKSRSLKPDPKL